MWALSNIVLFPQFIPVVIDLVGALLKPQEGEWEGVRRGGSNFRFEVKNIVVNLLYACREEQLGRVLGVWEGLVEFVKDVFYCDVGRKGERKEGRSGEMRKNLVVALGRFLECGVQVKEVYLKWGIDRCLEQVGRDGGEEVVEQEEAFGERVGRG